MEIEIPETLDVIPAKRLVRVEKESFYLELDTDTIPLAFLYWLLESKREIVFVDSKLRVSAHHPDALAAKILPEKCKFYGINYRLICRNLELAEYSFPGEEICS